MGRANPVKSFFQNGLRTLRDWLEAETEALDRSPWVLDSVEKVMLMWPEDSSLCFAHLRRLYRYGFRLSSSSDGFRLRLFFADGEMYRPEGYSRDSESLRADLAHLASETSPLRLGQCRVARAKPVLKALGFPDLDTAESYAIQFAWLDNERWIFIDSRPDVFRREIAAIVADKIVRCTRPPQDVST